MNYELLFIADLTQSRVFAASPIQIACSGRKRARTLNERENQLVLQKNPTNLSFGRRRHCRFVSAEDGEKLQKTRQVKNRKSIFYSGRVSFYSQT